MSISSAMYTAVTGLNTMGTAMSIISNNITNVNTVGYKQARPQFMDILSQRIYASAGGGQIGQGVTLGSVNNVFSQGSFQNSDENTSLAISGEGLFLVRDPDSSAVYYSRAGNFTRDAEGRLINPLGYVVQGWALNEEEVRTGEPTDIVLTASSLPPAATDKTTIILNLESGRESQSPTLWATWDGTKDNPMVGSNYVYQTSIRVFDTLGETHDLSIYFDPDYNPPHATLTQNFAQLETGLLGADNDLSFIADTNGATGDAITVTFADPGGNNAALSVGVVGSAITVNLATDGGGAITSTAAEVLAVVNGDTSAAALVTATLKGVDNGTGVVIALGATNLSRGTNNSLTYTADVGGANANNVRIEYVDPKAISQDLLLTAVTGNLIQINLATDGSGVVTSTADEVMALINDDVSAAALVDVTLTGALGSGVIVATSSSINLTGGSDIDTTPNKWEYVISSGSNEDFRTIGGIATTGTTYAGLMMKGSIIFDPNTGMIDTSNPNALTAQTLTDISGATPVWSDAVAATELIPTSSGYFELSANFINGGAAQGIEINLGMKNPLGLGTWQAENLSTTQFASTSTTNFQTQNGYSSGFLQGLSVANSGMIFGSYSNGQTIGAFQLALGLFQNPWALAKHGQNLYSETRNSGSATIAPAGDGGAGVVHSNALEQSNVDLAQEFVDMIVIQRGFQANAKTITTTDTLLAELIQLKR